MIVNNNNVSKPQLPEMAPYYPELLTISALERM
jgi:hypothetical protein